MLCDFVITFDPATVSMSRVAYAMNAVYPARPWYFDGTSVVSIPNVPARDVWDYWKTTTELALFGITVTKIEYVTD